MSDTLLRIDPTVPAGPIAYTSDVRANFKAAQDQIDALAIGVFLPLAGGTMEGPLLLAADPVDPLEPATKQYVDTSIAAIPSVDLTGYATELYVDDAIAAIPPALPLAGGTMEGPLLLAADPVDPLEPATKQYVDTSIAAIPSVDLTGYATELYVDDAIAAIPPALPLAGGTMQGPLLLAADPVDPLEPATKQYADNAFLPNSGPLTVTAPFTVKGSATPPVRGVLLVSTDSVANDGAVVGAWNTANNNGCGFWWSTNTGTMKLGAMGSASGSASTQWMTITSLAMTVMLPLVVQAGNPVTAAAPPTSGNHLTNKTYVDASIAAAVAPLRAALVAAGLLVPLGDPS